MKRYTKLLLATCPKCDWYKGYYKKKLTPSTSEDIATEELVKHIREVHPRRRSI